MILTHPIAVRSAVALVAALSGLTAGCHAPANRPRLDLDGTWRFRFAPDDRGDTEQWYQSATSFERTISVPGCWDAQGVGAPTDKMRTNAIGVGWYQRELNIPRNPAWTGKRVWLVVGGAHRTVRAWLNGNYLGDHIGYPTAWRVELTPALRRNGQQQLVLAVDSRRDPACDPLVGTFDVIDFMDLNWGGLFEHVWLEATGDAWIESVFVAPDPLNQRTTTTVELSAAAGELSWRVRVRGPERVLAEGAAPVTAHMLQLVMALPGAPLWTPSEPHLLELDLWLRSGNTTLDAKHVLFGLRRFEARPDGFYLNGDRFFVRGYGDDFCFPLTLVPAADVAFWRDYLHKRREFGFNGVRHHSMLPSESYLAAADEVGMLVQPELPIAYQVFLDQASPQARRVYARVWRDYICQMRNHPSVMAWCMSNELWQGFAEGPELYALAKQLDPTRAVIDTDGVWPQTSRPTLDYRVVQFDEGVLPWGRGRGKYALKDQRRPVIVHEMSNLSCLPDPREADQLNGAIPPFWLTAMMTAVRAQHLEPILPRMLAASQQLQTSLLKLNLEAARLAGVDGYYQWLFRDYWTQSSGLESILGQTRSLDAARMRQFNSDTVLLWDHDHCNYVGGQSVPVRLFLSDYRPGAAPELGGPSVSLDGVEVRLAPPAITSGRGLLGPWTGLAVAPVLEQPARLTLRAQAGPVENNWPIWVWPAAPQPPAAAVVARRLTPDMLARLEGGEAVLLADERCAFPELTASYKPAWWKGDEQRDFVHGNMFVPHAALAGLPAELFGDLQTFELLDRRPVVNLDEVPGGVQPIIWCLDVPWRLRRLAYLFEARVGRGRLLVSTLNLGPRARTVNPAAAWLFAQLAAYARSPQFQPAAEISSAWLRERLSNMAIPDVAQCLEGFAELVGQPTEESAWHTHREDNVPIYVVRQTDGRGRLSWRTAPLPEKWAAPQATFVWAGGIGYRSQSGNGLFKLSIKGGAELNIPFTAESSEWNLSDVKLQYLILRRTVEDTFGLFYLTLPSLQLSPGQPVELSWSAEAGQSRRWISVAPYRDVVASDEMP